MPSKRDLKLHKYDVSRNKYRELLYFCMQYTEKKERLNSFCEMSAITYSDMPKSSGTSDRTAQQAERNMLLKEDIELIEQTAIEADSGIYQYLIRNVTDGIRYEYMEVPCGRRQFYEARRRFFYLLSLKK